MKPRFKIHVDGSFEVVVKTPAEVRAEFVAAGVNMSAWARVNGFHRQAVVELLNGTRQGLRGETHRAAVALGLKAGYVGDVAQFKPAARSTGQQRKRAAA